MNPTAEERSWNGHIYDAEILEQHGQHFSDIEKNGMVAKCFRDGGGLFRLKTHKRLNLATTLCLMSDLALYSLRRITSGFICTRHPKGN